MRDVAKIPNSILSCKLFDTFYTENRKQRIFRQFFGIFFYFFAELGQVGDGAARYAIAGVALRLYQINGKR